MEKLCDLHINFTIYNDIINLKRNTYVQWLPTAAVIFHSSLIKNKFFDESFGRCCVRCRGGGGGGGGAADACGGRVFGATLRAGVD